VQLLRDPQIMMTVNHLRDVLTIRERLKCRKEYRTLSKMLLSPDEESKVRQQLGKQAQAHESGVV
jgi:hypothetical protein